MLLLCFVCNHLGHKNLLTRGKPSSVLVSYFSDVPPNLTLISASLLPSLTEGRKHDAWDADAFWLKTSILLCLVFTICFLKDVLWVRFSVIQGLSCSCDVKIFLEY